MKDIIIFALILCIITLLAGFIFWRSKTNKLKNIKDCETCKFHKWGYCRWHLTNIYNVRNCFTYWKKDE